MKKQLAWISVLFFALLFFSASAEGTGPVVNEFEDFILRTDAALALRSEKADGQALFLFYPYTEAGIAMTAVNAVWTRETTRLTVEAFSLLYREAEGEIRRQYEVGGLSLLRYESGEAQEKEAWGTPALFCDAVLLIGINDTEAPLYQRMIRLTGDFGTYAFSLSAWSPELLDEAAEYLFRALEWK